MNDFQDAYQQTDELDRLSVDEYVGRLTPSSALDNQIAGSHYKNLKIQPMEYSMANKLDACQHTAIKYITRFREKGGIQDLDKAIHCIQMLKEFEYGSY
jgi:hypothetical protein